MKCDKRYTISFPHLADYCVPVTWLLSAVFPDHTIAAPPPITQKTIELGAKYSPDSVCVPFKYNLGNFIEALDGGANLLFTAGGGCRFGYYAELQEQILRDLGYQFEMSSLFSGGVNLFSLYDRCKCYGARINLLSFASKLLLTFKMIRLMDKNDAYIRQRIGFECKRGSFEAVRRDFLRQLGAVESHGELDRLGRDYTRELECIAVKIPPSPLRVGVVGELYTLMEGFASFNLEKILGANGIEISRFTNATYLLFEKDRSIGRVLRQASEFIRYPLGADGTESVAHAASLASAGFDGIIHIKPFGCMPEVNAMPALMRVGERYKIPIVYFSFDAQTSETGVRTRLEAFCDMIRLKKERKKA